MTTASTSGNAAQIENWNSQSGRTWVEFQAQLDAQIEPLGAAALALLGARAGESILDVGCGCGQTSLSLAAAVGATGRVLGVDVSAPMLDVARTRASQGGFTQVEFRQLDAQVAALDARSFDALYSRFGVMFFADPLAAFTNLRASLKPGGRLSFVCWRALEQNPWMVVPLEAARTFLPPSPPPDPLAPGPLAFADPGRVRSILHGAGYTRLSVEAFDTEIGGAALDAAAALALRVGPLGAALRENPGLTTKVRTAVRAALAPYETPAGVLLPAAVWLVSAHS